MKSLRNIFNVKNESQLWEYRELRPLSTKLLHKINSIALDTDQRIYQEDFIFKKRPNKFKLVVDLDDTLALGDLKAYRVYLRKSVLYAISKIKKTHNAYIILWTNSTKGAALEKFRQYPELFDLFDEIIFGESFIADQSFMLADQFDLETKNLEALKNKLIKSNNPQMAEKINRAIIFRKKYPYSKNLELMDFDLLIDNSYTAERTLKVVNFNLIRIPTYTFDKITEENKPDYIQLENFIYKLPLLIPDLSESTSHSLEVIRNYQDELNFLEKKCNDTIRTRSLLKISQILDKEDLTPESTHRHFVQNNRFITFSAICKPKNKITIPDKSSRNYPISENKIFLKLRVSVKHDKFFEGEREFRSFLKESDVLNEYKDKNSFLPQYIGSNEVKNINYHKYWYIPFPRIGDTRLLNPNINPQDKTITLLIDTIKKIQELEISKKLKDSLFTFTSTDVEREWNDKNKFEHTRAQGFVKQAELLESKKYILNTYNELQKNNYTLCHGDFHPANILLSKNKIFVLDWELLQYNNPAFDFSMFWLRSWNYPIWRNKLLDEGLKNFGDNFLKFHYANILYLSPSEISHWKGVSSEPWRHHYLLAEKAIQAHRIAFYEALNYFRSP